LSLTNPASLEDIKHIISFYYGTGILKAK